MAVSDVWARSLDFICQFACPDVAKDGIEFDREVEFDNGVRMAVQVCGPGDPAAEPCWTQGVLFDPDGSELGCTDVGESFLGEYTIDWNGDTYTTIVKPLGDS